MTSAASKPTQKFGDVDRFLGFDLETTGIDVKTARILTASLVSWRDGEFIPSTSIINPGIPIPEDSIKIHGLTDEYIQEFGDDPVESLPGIRDVIKEAWVDGVPVVGHNVTYDLTVLSAELKRYDLEPLVLKGPVLDTMVMHRMLGNRKATLAVTAEKYGVTNEKAHSSEADTIATLKIALAMRDSVPYLNQKDLRDLFREQQSYHYSWARDLESYFYRQGKYDKVNGEWPMQTI